LMLFEILEIIILIGASLGLEFLLTLQDLHKLQKHLPMSLLLTD
jgi:hypothetical protein